MADSTPIRVEEVLNSFAEVMSALMIDQYQKQLDETLRHLNSRMDTGEQA